MWGFSILGLIAPILYMIDIVLLLYWLVSWRRFFIIPFVALLIGAANISLFFRPVFSKSYKETQRDKSTINILTYNVIGFINPANNRGESCLEDALAFTKSLSPDIVCFQEYQTTPLMTQSKIDDLLIDFPHKRINYKVQNRDNTGWGLAIFSRYQIIGSGNIDFEGSNNSSMWADIVVKRDTIRVFNNHMQTTSITTSDRTFITTQEFVESNNEVKSKRIRSIIGKLRNNYKIRATQADTIALKMSESPHPLVVCGDFNDTPISYTYNTIRGDLRDAFSEKGQGVTNTYKGFFNMFRIDYVLYSPVIEATSYSSPSSEWSDHNPVLVSLVLPSVPTKKR